MLKLQSLSLLEVEKFSTSEPHILISLTREEPKLPNLASRVAILRVVFDDITAERPWLRALADGKLKAIDDNQARQILAFVGEYKDKVSLVVVHCTAGLSRSPAVVKALSEMYDSSIVNTNVPWPPNQLVYNTLVKVHCDQVTVAALKGSI